MDSNAILPIIFGAVIGLYIWYEIIKGAVRAANKDLLASIELQNRLLLKLLKTHGVSKPDLADAVSLDTKVFFDSKID